MRTPWKTLMNRKRKSNCVEMNQDACKSSQRAPQKRQHRINPCHTHRLASGQSEHQPPGQSLSHGWVPSCATEASTAAGTRSLDSAGLPSPSAGPQGGSS